MNAHLKNWLVQNGYAAADASDDEMKAARQKALDEGKLTLDSISDLIEGKGAASAKDKAAELADTIASKTAKAVGDALGGRFDQLITVLTPQKQAASNGNGDAPDDLDKSAQDAAKRWSDDIDRQHGQPQTKGPKPQDVLGGNGGDKGAQPRVKAATERYDGTTKAVTWDSPRSPGMVGQPAKMWTASPDSPHAPAQREFDHMSQKQMAKAGAWLKWQFREAGMGIPLTDHDKQLILEAAEEDNFVGEFCGDGICGSRKLADHQKHWLKTVLDESGASAGASAVPEYFDDNIIVTPLLHSELFPLVTVIPVARGSSADGFSHGTPTFVSTASGSAVTPFSTTSFVSAFDTTFFPATCAIEFGLDFLSDAVPNFAQSVMNQIGQEALRWLDEQIAIGDGTNEPQGIFEASGTSVSSENDTGGALTYNDALNLAFGIDKAHRNAFGGTATVYVMNDSQYKQFMQVNTGVTGDTRPIFGMNIKDYMLGDYPVRVQNNISNGEICFANLRAYRLYRRQGIQFLQEDSGRTLRLANKRLLMARMRWGGQSTLPSGYIAQMTDASVS